MSSTALDLLEALVCAGGRWAVHRRGSRTRRVMIVDWVGGVWFASRKCALDVEASVFEGVVEVVEEVALVG